MRKKRTNERMNERTNCRKRKETSHKNANFSSLVPPLFSFSLSFFTLARWVRFGAAVPSRCASAQKALENEPAVLEALHH